VILLWIMSTVLVRVNKKSIYVGAGGAVLSSVDKVPS